MLSLARELNLCKRLYVSRERQLRYDSEGGIPVSIKSGVDWEIRIGCSIVKVIEGDAGVAACVLFCKEMSAYEV